MPRLRRRSPPPRRSACTPPRHGGSASAASPDARPGSLAGGLEGAKAQGGGEGLEEIFLLRRQIAARLLPKQGEPSPALSGGAPVFFAFVPPPMGGHAQVDQ